MDVREEVKWFAGEMEKKLRKNDWRPEWKDAEPEYLLDLFHGHVRKFEQSLCDGNEEKVTQDAADVANFAMMLADIRGAK